MYYVHPTRRVTTDIDLRQNKILDAITAYFENYKDSGGAPPGLEIWIRDAQVTKRGFAPERFWVDHRQRIVSSDWSHESATGTKKPIDDDRKYSWSP